MKKIEKRKKSFAAFGYYVFSTGTIILVLSLILGYRLIGNRGILNFFWEGLKGFFSHHYSYSGYQYFTLKFLPFALALFAAIFYLVLGIRIIRARPIPRITALIFTSYLIILLLVDFFSSYTIEIDLSLLPILILVSIFVLLLVNNNTTNNSGRCNRALVFFLILILVFVAVSSLYRPVDTFLVSIRNNERQFNNLRKNTGLPEIIRDLKLPEIEILLYQPEIDKYYFVPLVKSMYFEKIDTALELHGVEPYYDTRSSKYQFPESEAPPGIRDGMEKKEILSKFGLPNRMLWIYLESRNLSEIRYVILEIKNGKLQSLYRLIHDSLGIIKTNKLEFREQNLGTGNKTTLNRR